jgi:DNA repair protein RecO
LLAKPARVSYASPVRVTDDALLLRRFRFGESSLVVHAATRSHGRVHLLAKGVYRPSTRFYGALDLFDTLRLEWQTGPGRELGNLTAATILVRRHRLAADLDRYRAALTILELLEVGLQEEQPAGELFQLACGALDRLLTWPLPDRPLVEFELAFLQNLGLAPALSECASCGGPAPATGFPDREPEESRRVLFSAQCGGRLCADCAQEARALGRRVGSLPEKVLQAAARLAEPHRPHALPLDAATLVLVRDVAARFLEYQLQARPKSYRAFLSGPHRNRIP